jgi:hypothetical protein
MASHPKWVKALYSPKVFFFCLIWLCILLFWGTVDQKYIGLYQAQEKYFSSMLIWLGPFPIPGGRITLIIITINLVCKLLLNSPLKKKNIGIIITHLGSLCLLFGGFLTAYYANEGNMVIDEGAKASFYTDYHLLEITMIDTSNPEYNDVLAFTGNQVQKGNILKDTRSKLKVEILEFHKNIDVKPLTSEVPENYRGTARKLQMTEIKRDVQEEMNMSGVMLKVSGLDEAQNGVYLVYEFMQNPQILDVEGKEVYLLLRHKRYPLDFEIECLDFIKEEHPGTRMAKSYSSDVNVIRGGTKRHVTISMNQPLRTDGYTFYQSSFSQMEGRETTVLAVVRNVGRLFPYISSIVICIGIAIHLLIQLPKLLKKD